MGKIHEGIVVLCIGAVGMVVGTFGAIWMAKRFDELEAHFKDSDRDK